MRFFLFILALATANALNENWPIMVRDFFNLKNIKSINMHTCSKQDSIKAMKAFKNNPDVNFFAKSQPIFDKLAPKKYFTLGIFVDLTCTHNRRYFKSVAIAGVFNTTYIWLVFAMENDEIFNNLNLGPSSDLTLINSKNILIHLRRNRPDGGLIKAHLGQWRFKETFHFKVSPSVRHLHNAPIYFSIFSPQKIYDLGKEAQQILNLTHYNGKDVPNRFFYALHLIVAQMFNYSLELKITDDWGSMQPDGLFNGEIGMLQRGEANVTSELHLLPARIDVSDPLIPIINWWAPFAFVQPRLVGTPRALYLQLKPLVWICFGLLAIVGSLVFFTTQNLRTSNALKTDTSYSTGFIQMISVISQQGLIIEPERTSSRLVCVFMLMISSMIAIFYNAATMNALLSANPPSIRSLDELLQSKLKLALANEHYFRDKAVRKRVLDEQVMSKIDSFDRKLFTFEEGLKLILEGEAFAAEYFWLFDAMDKHFDDSVKCGLTIIQPHRPSPATSFIVKDSPLREMFMQGFLRIKELGLYNREYLRWIPSKPKCVPKQEFLFVKLQAVSIAFGIYLCGLIASLMILILEILSIKWRKNATAVKITLLSRI